jgi:hypothetical protein
MRSNTFYPPKKIVVNNRKEVAEAKILSKPLLSRCEFRKISIKVKLMLEFWQTEKTCVGSSSVYVIVLSRCEVFQSFVNMFGHFC